jgi:hypothetical protein
MPLSIVILTLKFTLVLILQIQINKFANLNKRLKRNCQELFLRYIMMIF